VASFHFASLPTPLATFPPTASLPRGSCQCLPTAATVPASAAADVPAPLAPLGTFIRTAPLPAALRGRLAAVLQGPCVVLGASAQPDGEDPFPRSTADVAADPTAAVRQREAYGAGVAGQGRRRAECCEDKQELLRMHWHAP